MTAADREAAARRQRAQEIALWRWTLVEPAMDPALTARERGAIVRDLASREHEGPDGRTKTAVSRRTLDRWVVARSKGGFEALVPSPRQCPPRTGAEVIDLAVGLKMENPARTAAQVRRILIARLGPAQVPTDRAIQRWFAGRELNTGPCGRPPEAFGRFEADAVNEIWTADLMNGPVIGGRDCHLSVIIDDRSRFLPAARFVRRPDAIRFAGVFRSAIGTCGVPRLLYCDNGSAYIDKSLRRTCAVLGIKLTHSEPGRRLTDGPGQGGEGHRDDPAAVHGRDHRRRGPARPAEGVLTGGAEPAAGGVGPGPSATAGSTPRPGKPREPAGTRPGRSSSRLRAGSGMRSPGPISGWSARRRPSSSKETCTPWTRSSSAGRSSWSSTRPT
jgi:transposase InsO family protein